MLRMVQNYLFQFALHHVIYTVFPYTTLFRSLVRVVGGDPGTELGQSVLDLLFAQQDVVDVGMGDRKSTRLNSSHVAISYAVFCVKKKKARDDASVAESDAKRLSTCTVALGAS